MSTKTRLFDNFRRHGAFSGIAPPDTTRELPGVRATVFPGAMEPAHLIRVRSGSLPSRISLCRRKFMSTKINFRRHEIIFVDIRCLAPQTQPDDTCARPQVRVVWFLDGVGRDEPWNTGRVGQARLSTKNITIGACRRKLENRRKVPKISKKTPDLPLRNGPDTAR